MWIVCFVPLKRKLKPKTFKVKEKQLRCQLFKLMIKKKEDKKVFNLGSFTPSVLA